MLSDLRRWPITKQLQATVGGHWVYNRSLARWVCGDGKRYMMAFGGGYTRDDWDVIHYPRDYFIYEPGKPTLRFTPAPFGFLVGATHR